MSKVERYYVDDTTHVNNKVNIVIRDRISPLEEVTYPTDIAVDIMTGMFPSLPKQRDIAAKICKLLNEEL